MTKIKHSCVNCIHNKVCSIYEFAIKHNRDSVFKFQSSAISDICGHYRQS